MKKGCLWALGLFFLIVIMCAIAAPSTQDSVSNKDSFVETGEEETFNDEKEKKIFIDTLKAKELSKHFTEKKDEFSDVKWVEPKTRPKYTNQNGYCMYFAIENGVADNPRFLIQYESDDWLFIQYIIFNVDGENITFTPKSMDTDCGNGGRIWEWCDESAMNLESLIKKIAYAKSVKLKLVGKQYYDTKTMSTKQIQHFKYSYEYYKAMGGTFN